MPDIDITKGARNTVPKGTPQTPSDQSTRTEDLIEPTGNINNVGEYVPQVKPGPDPSIDWTVNSNPDTDTSAGQPGEAIVIPDTPDNNPGVTYEKTAIYEELIQDFSPEKLAEYEALGATVVSLMDDGTEVETQWQTVVDPAIVIQEFHNEALELASAVQEAVGQANERLNTQSQAISAIQNEAEDFRRAAEVAYNIESSLDPDTGEYTKLMEARYGGRNLSPFFAHPLDDYANYKTNAVGADWTDNDAYWLMKSTNAGWQQNVSGLTFTIDQLGDGWAHVVYDNQSGASRRFDFVVAAPENIGEIKENTNYTFLFEVRNNKSTGLSSQNHFYIVQTGENYTKNIMFWGTTITKLLEGTGNAAVINLLTECPPGTEGIYRKRFIKKTEATGSARWDANATTRTLTSFVFITNTGGKLDFDIRVSMYEGEYKGEYKPYVPGGRTLATRHYVTESVDAFSRTIEDTYLKDSEGNPRFTSKTEFEQTTSGIKATAEAALTTAENITVGGRNLLLNSDNTSKWTLFAQAYNCAKIKMSEKMVAGKTYTIRVWGDVSRSDKEAVLLAYLNGGTTSLARLAKSDDGTWTASFMGKATTAATDTIWLYIGPTPATGTTYTANITKAKLEVGNKATDWTPAPEDMATLASLSEYTQRSEFSVEPSKISSYVDDSLKTATGINDWRNTSMKQYADSITLSAEARTTNVANLTPFFSHPIGDVRNATTNPDGYWYSNYSAWITNLEDGWARYTFDNSSGTGTVFKQLAPSHIDALKNGTSYTTLVEIRNVSNLTGDVYVRTPDASRQIAGAKDSKLTNEDATFRIVGVGNGSDTQFGFAIRHNAGSSATFEIRASLYESPVIDGNAVAYAGPYKPYVPSDASLYEAHAAIKVNQSNIQSEVEARKSAINELQAGGGNIFKNSNVSGHIASPSTWAAGTWQESSGGSGRGAAFALTDAPEAWITHGYYIANNASGHRDLVQWYLPMAEGASYTAGAWFRIREGADAAKAQIRFWADGANVKGATMVCTTEWQWFSVTCAKFPAGKKNTGILFGLTGAGSIDMCGFSLVRETTALTNVSSRVTQTETDITQLFTQSSAGVEITYFKNNSSISAPADNAAWQATVPTRSTGEHIWMKVVTKGYDASTKTTKTLSTTKTCITGNDGTNGTPGGKWYFGTGITGTSTTETVFSGSGVSSAVVGDMYLNTSTSNTYRCTVAGAASAAKWVYVNNLKGAAGKGISSTAITYQLHTSGTAAPTGTWSTSVPATTKDKPYLWTKTVTTYTDSTTSTAYSVSQRGTDGTAGKGVSSAASTYQISDSGTTAPTGTWATSVPATTTAKPFLWTKTVTTYTDSSTTTAYAVSKQGADGVAGKGISSITEYYALSNSTTAPADSSFTTGAKTPTATNRYLWNYEKVTYSDGTTKNLDKHIAAVYGEKGNTGKGITSIAEYYVATSSTTAPADSEFSTAVAATSATNKYLWNYEIVTYSDSTTEKTAKRIIGTYGDKGDEGEKGDDGQLLLATCTTAAGTAAKVATLAAGSLKLVSGATVSVIFSNANTAATPTLNIGGTGAKRIMAYNQLVTSSTLWRLNTVNQPITFVYDATGNSNAGVWVVADAAAMHEYVRPSTTGLTVGTNYNTGYSHVLNTGGFKVMQKGSATAEENPAGDDNNVSLSELMPTYLRLGKKANAHLYANASALAFVEGGYDDVGKTSANNIFMINNTPEVRIGKYAQPHIFVNSTGIGINPANTNDASATGGSTTFLGDSTARIGKYASPHLFIDATSMGFNVASKNNNSMTADDALLAINSTPQVRIGKYSKPHVWVTDSSFSIQPGGSNADNDAGFLVNTSGIRFGQIGTTNAVKQNVFIDSSGVYIRKNTTNLASFTDSAVTIGQTGANLNSVKIDSNGLTVFDGTTQIANFGKTRTVIGRDNERQVRIDSEGLAIGVGLSEDSTGAYIARFNDDEIWMNGMWLQAGGTGHSIRTSNSESFCIENTTSKNYSALELTDPSGTNATTAKLWIQRKVNNELKEPQISVKVYGSTGLSEAIAKAEKITIEGDDISIKGSNRTTVTNLNKATNIDRDGDAPTSNTWGNSELTFKDKDGERIGLVNIQRRTNGSMAVWITPRNENDEGSETGNGITIIADKNGTMSYSVGTPAAFRSAISIGAEYLSLGSGTAIPAISDLNANTYLTPGNYHCSSTNNAKTVTNRPPGCEEAFTMKVGFATGTGYPVQEVTAYSSGITWRRHSTSTTDATKWGSWSVIRGRVTLFSSSTASNGTITLSSSAANFTHMVIHYNLNGSTNGVGSPAGSIEVYNPNGKYVTLGGAYLALTNTLQYRCETVLISGTKITPQRGGYFNVSTSQAGSLTTENSVYITRVEAW